MEDLAVSEWKMERVFMYRFKEFDGASYSKISIEEYNRIAENYRETIIRNLVLKHAMSEHDAEKAFDNSVVALMLKRKTSGIWQMHQSLEYALSDIYEEYCGN